MLASAPKISYLFICTEWISDSSKTKTADNFGAFKWKYIIREATLQVLKNHFSWIQLPFSTNARPRDIHIECSKQFKWIVYFYVYGQSGPFWAVLKVSFGQNDDTKDILKLTYL